MFPALAGINRQNATRPLERTGVPRASGDKPDAGAAAAEWPYVFPALAGINRPGNFRQAQRLSVPRVSGDKPGGHDGDRQTC